MLLAGLAQPVKERLGCKLVCWLQDEDGFVDGLGSPWTEKVWVAMKEKAFYFDMFLPVSQYYAKLMQQRLDIPDQKINIIAPGVDITQYEPAERTPDVKTLGFLGRMYPANGLDIMVASYEELAGEYENLQLSICGGKTSADKNYIAEQQKILAGAGLHEKSEFLEDFDFTARRSFLKKLSVLCAPSRQAPAYALNVMESCACGVPFVAPNTGVFTELAETTSAGVLYEMNTPEQLQQTLDTLLKDSGRLQELAKNGRHAAMKNFDIRKNAGIFVEMLSQL
jgi:glycosyltransferase involved in cell wall biosynthesis